MKKPLTNYAYIDSQNLHLGIRKLGWELDYRRFRVYLSEKYGVSKAYLFIGFVALNQRLYDRLQEAGFILKFKPTVPDGDGNIKGNIDADLVLQTMLDFQKFEKAVIVSSDGDFYSLVQHLYDAGKLEVVLSPDEEHCSTLLKRVAPGKIWFMNNLRRRLEFKNERRLRTEPQEALVNRNTNV